MPTDSKNCSRLFAIESGPLSKTWKLKGFVPESKTHGGLPKANSKLSIPDIRSSKFGFHNVTAANGVKEALAVDMLDDDHPANEGKQYLLRLAAAAKKQDLITGIRWGLPTQRLRDAIDTAIANNDWNAQVKIGWDPTHCEPTGLTPAEAKAGRRPA